MTLNALKLNTFIRPPAAHLAFVIWNDPFNSENLKTKDKYVVSAFSSNSSPLWKVSSSVVSTDEEYVYFIYIIKQEMCIKHGKKIPLNEISRY